MPETLEQLLERAASLCGIDPGYWDNWGRYHETSLETRRAILAGLGFDAPDEDGLASALNEFTRREWQRLAPPVAVVGENDQILPLNVPAEWLGEQAHITVVSETGERMQAEVPLRELPQLSSIEMNGQTIVRKPVPLPVRLPLGYHQVIVELGGSAASTRYIVTPDRAYVPPFLGQGGRCAGLAVSLYGVRSGRNWGCGDFRDLRGLIDYAAGDLHAAFIALNPLHAIHNRRPFNTSPYLPNCGFYQNFIYLDIESIPDFAASPHAQHLWNTAEVQQEIAALRDAEFVEYERLAALKLRFLKLMFLHFRHTAPPDHPRAREFQSYVDREGQLLRQFAIHCALDEHIHARDSEAWMWTEWPQEFQDPGSPETAAFAEKHHRSVELHQYVQWQIDVQLSDTQQYARNRRMPIGLYHDLALATDRFGADLWAHRPFYISGCRVGAPPDDFSPRGQDWGFPPPNILAHRENGYRLFADSIRKNCRHGGALRIDHVMRLFRLYWIPDGTDAAHGAYVREQSGDFLRILALESVRNQVVVIGEDLGTVEPAVRESLAKAGIFSYRVFYFEKNEQGAFRRHDEYPAQSLVSSSTHDLPTLAGFWAGTDIELRRSTGMIDDPEARKQSETRAAEKQRILDLLTAEGLCPPGSTAATPELTGELHNAIMGFLALTSSKLLAINQEDLTKEVHQQNLPGATWQYPNWGRKMRFTLEQLTGDPTANSFTTMVRNWIEKSGRGSQNL